MRTLYVISDLHLGGRPHDSTGNPDARPGSQFNHAYAELVDFIDWVGEQVDGASQTELVINGDIVDFLADDDAAGGAEIWTGNEQAACIKLDLIAARTRLGGKYGVFEALGALVATGARLTLLLGNHDVELSLPAVRRHLSGLLGGEQANVHFIYDGEAYLTDRVLIEHGNRYDRWNRLDYNALRQERSVRSRGQQPDVPYFSPPAGTRMVVEVINRIKRTYRFIDLLKPETGVALPLLIALEPSLGNYLDALVKAHLVRPLLAAGGTDGAGHPEHADYMREDVAPALADVLADELGHEAARLFCDPASHANAATGGAPDLLGIRQHVATVAAWRDAAFPHVQTAANGLAALVRQAGATISEMRQRQLHAGLRHAIARDGSFNIGVEDSNYLTPARALIAGGGVDVVINGHTHLPKQIRLHQPGRRCWYLNTGTWCDVLRLPAMAPAFEDARASLDTFLAALRANDLERHAQRYLSWVEVRILPDSAPEPALYSWCGRENARCAPLTACQTPGST